MSSVYRGDDRKSFLAFRFCQMLFFFFLSHVRLKIQSWMVVLDIGYKRAFTVHVIHRCSTPGECNVTNIRPYFQNVF